ncbi:MAG: CopD family protein [Nitrospirota bacterium]|nr:CopD family protein [Nitrospirota bacterium]
MAWWLTFHLLGVILWTGGLLAISRMAAYHVVEAREVQARFAWVEGRMYWLVAVPGLVITLITAAGIMHAGWMPYAEFDWFRGKAVLLALLAGLHVALHIMLGRLREHPERQKKAVFSAIHGSIGLTVIGILIMVMVRPGN